tara:strand:- start:307 stop:453 length:147 start_codon:yes stop_codon:yes gene_type:complete
MDHEEYVHINDDPHDGWWLRPEWQDENDEHQDLNLDAIAKEEFSYGES